MTFRKDELRLPLHEQVKLRVERIAERDFKNGYYNPGPNRYGARKGGAWDTWYWARYRELLLDRLSDIESR